MRLFHFLSMHFFFMFPPLWNRAVAAVQHIFSFKIEEISKRIKQTKCERNIEYFEQSCLFLLSSQRNLSSVLDSVFSAGVKSNWK